MLSYQITEPSALGFLGRVSHDGRSKSITGEGSANLTLAPAADGTIRLDWNGPLPAGAVLEFSPDCVHWQPASAGQVRLEQPGRWLGPQIPQSGFYRLRLD